MSTAPEMGQVVSLCEWRRRRLARWGDRPAGTDVEAAGEGFTLDRFLERARLVLVEGGGGGADDAAAVVPFPVPRHAAR